MPSDKSVVLNKIFTLCKIACTFCACLHIVHNFYDMKMTNNIFVIFILVGVCLIYTKSYKESFVKSLGINILSVLFTICTVTGLFFENDIPFARIGVYNFMMYIVCVLGMIPLCKYMFSWLYYLVEKWSSWEHTLTQQAASTQRKAGWKTFLFAFVVIMLGWSVVWLAYYPGFFNYDPWQVLQVMNSDYNKHHPLLHTIFLGGLYCYGLEIGSPNTGIVIYSLVQMSIMAAIFAYTYVYIKSRVNSRLFLAVTLIFYAIFPVNSVLSFSTTKDVLFTGMVLWASVIAVKYFSEKESLSKNARILTLVLAGISIVMMMLFRNNALYALCLYIPLLLIERKRHSMKIIVFLICCILSFKVIDAGLTQYFNAYDGSSKEMYGVMIQQHGRVYSAAKSVGDRETVEKIEYFYENVTEESYKPSITDPMKHILREFSTTEELIDYVTFSVNLFFEYPMITIDSFLYTTKGAWDIGDTSVAKIYGEGYEGRPGYLLTDIKYGFGIIGDSKIPALEMEFERLFSANEYKEIPLLNLIFAPALYFWLMIFCYVGFFYSKNYKNILVSTFLLFLYLTMLLGPCILVRYMYPFFVCAPLLLCMLKDSICERNV